MEHAKRLTYIFIFIWRFAVCTLLIVFLLLAANLFTEKLIESENIASFILSGAFPSTALPVSSQPANALPSESLYSNPSEYSYPDSLPLEGDRPLSFDYYSELSLKSETPIALQPGEYKIKTVDLSAPVGTLINETSYKPLLAAPVFSRSNTAGKSFPKDQPLVLIIHTHGTECYSENGFSYSDSTSTRTQDVNKNIVAVGKAMKSELEKLGVPSIHCTEMFDIDSYNDSYVYSGEAVAEYLKECPSIKYVFDIHRDSIIYSDSVKARPLSESEDGKTKAAQIMFVVGTDQGGAVHPDWKDNLLFAESLKAILEDIFPSVTRSVNLRKASFNQQLSAGFLLAEIGSCGNTLNDAKESAKLLAKALFEYISGQ